MTKVTEIFGRFTSKDWGVPGFARCLVGIAAAVAMVSPGLGCSSTSEYTRAQPSYFVCADSGNIDECPKPSPAAQSSTAQSSPPAIITPPPGAGSANYPISDIFTVECTYGEKTPAWQKYTINPLSGTMARTQGHTCLYKAAYFNRLQLDQLDGLIADQSAQKKPQPGPPSNNAAAGKDGAGHVADPAGAAPDPSDAAAAPSSAPTAVQVNTGPAHQRDETVAELLQISDHNCNSFLGRAFANSAGMSFFRGMISAVSSSAAAVTGFASVPAASALSATNIGAGDTLDAFNNAYYAKHTFQDVEKAIRLQRAKIKDRIVQCESSACPAESAEEAAIDAQQQAADAQSACDAADSALKQTQTQVTSNAGTKTPATDAAKSLDSLNSSKDEACNAAQQASDAAGSAADAAKAAKAGSPPKSSPSGTYLLVDALNDVQDYDNQCSLNSGLISLDKVVDSAAASGSGSSTPTTSTDPNDQKTVAKQAANKATAASTKAKKANQTAQKTVKPPDKKPPKPKKS